MLNKQLKEALKCAIQALRKGAEEWNYPEWCTAAEALEQLLLEEPHD